MYPLTAELNKIEANACIVQGHLDLYTQMNKAVYMLKEAGLSETEIDDFIAERSKAAARLGIAKPLKAPARFGTR